jgi:hypothetical protein
LLGRFGRTILPSAARQPELYERLWGDGILSTVETKPLPYDVPFTFTAEELAQFRRFNEFPESALRRLADDEDRNKLIVERVRKVVDDGAVLLFANLVEHAQHLTARLCLSGVPAASIYADTDVAVRQYFIRQFLDGRVKVLSNYQMLATGFDGAEDRDHRHLAASVQSGALDADGRPWIARSEERGHQDLQIITVVDNLVQYGDRLAYHYFMRHYSRSRRPAVLPDIISERLIELRFIRPGLSVARVRSLALSYAAHNSFISFRRDDRASEHRLRREHG